MQTDSYGHSACFMCGESNRRSYAVVLRGLNGRFPKGDDMWTWLCVDCMPTLHGGWRYVKQGNIGGHMSLILFKDGDQLGIQTDCATEQEFTMAFASALENLITEKKFEGDWNFQLQHWLIQFAEIVCSYRGYRATEVRKSVVLSVGNTNPQDAAYKELAGEMNKPVLEGFLKHVNGEAKA